MTDRDRLIELLKGAETKVSEVLSKPLALEEWLGVYADYLISNGVILPPCKVGDYVVWNDGFEIQNKEVYGFIYNPHQLGLRYILEDCSPIINHEAIVGILTKEEAEKALAERSGDNA